MSAARALALFLDHYKRHNEVVWALGGFKPHPSDGLYQPLRLGLLPWRPDGKQFDCKVYSTMPWVDLKEAQLSVTLSWNWEMRLNALQALELAVWQNIGDNILAGRRFFVHPKNPEDLFAAGRFSGVPVNFAVEGRPIRGLHLEATANLEGWRAFFPRTTSGAIAVANIEGTLEAETVPA